MNGDLLWLLLIPVVWVAMAHVLFRKRFTVQETLVLGGVAQTTCTCVCIG
jgi:hypothetical protein